LTQNSLEVGKLFHLFNHKYKIIKQIGFGGYGSVWLIKKGDSVLALKTIHLDKLKHFVHTPEYVALTKESEAYLTMDIHPYLLIFIAFYRDEHNNIFAVFEYVKGGSLAKMISKKGIRDFKLIIDLAIHISSGIAYLHSHEIIHRDLNPHNVLVEEIEIQENAERLFLGKVSDLGLTKLIKFEHTYPDDEIVTTSLTLSKIISTIGNEDYTAPEQKLDPSKATRDADVYSFGLTMCKMITGKLPSKDRLYRSYTNYEQAVQELTKHIKSFFNSTRKDTDDKIIELVIKCLHNNPKFRWKDEKLQKRFFYFNTLREELIRIRSDLFGNFMEPIGEFGNRQLLYQFRGYSFYQLALIEKANRKIEESNTKFEKAKHYFLMALEFDNQNVNTLCGLGLTHKEVDEFDLSLEYYDKALEDNGKDSMIYVYIGVVFSKKGLDPQWVIAYYDLALKFDSDNFDAHLNKGIELFEKLDKEQAKSCFDSSMDLNENNPKLNYYLGWYYLDKGNAYEYERYFTNALQLSQHVLEYYHKICNILLDYGVSELTRKYINEGLNYHRNDTMLEALLKQLN
jgi:serine/threonine protein kinase/Tfp pilus assembly protein PilF